MIYGQQKRATIGRWLAMAKSPLFSAAPILAWLRRHPHLPHGYVWRSDLHEGATRGPHVKCATWKPFFWMGGVTGQSCFLGDSARCRPDSPATKSRPFGVPRSWRTSTLSMNLPRLASPKT